LARRPAVVSSIGRALAKIRTFLCGFASVADRLSQGPIAASPAFYPVDCDLLEVRFPPMATQGTMLPSGRAHDQSVQGDLS
jgi:hypothetical protein